MPGINDLWRILKLHTDQLRNLEAKQQAIAPGGNVIITGGSGVLLSDDDPLPVADLPDPGTSMEASRSDHVHVGGTSSGQYRMFVYTNDNPFQFVVDGDGQPVFSLQDLE